VLTRYLPALAFASFAAVFSIDGCVPVPPDMMNQVDAPKASSTTVVGSFKPLDAGAATGNSLHFVVMAYGQDLATQIADQADQDYSRIMQDTGLYSYMSGAQYHITVYASPDEYHTKTAMPLWSGGVTVGNEIYSFQGPNLRSTLAHEMTHVIFNEFMVSSHPELRWINEGLAVYEEIQSSSPEAAAAWETQMAQTKKGNMTFAQMLQTAPLEEKKPDDVSLWYAQAASVTAYMLNVGGRLGFQAFLTALKSGSQADAALSTAFPGRWGTMANLEPAWRQS
jgi:hypothetical protein